MDTYEIRVAGHLSLWRAQDLGCEGLRLLPDGESLLTFAAIDQPALYGLMTRLRDAGLELLAAERGGNCELTRPSQVAVEHGVSIVGTINLASTVPYHASQMYAKNVTAFLVHLFKGGKPELNLEDEITRETLVTRNGEIVNKRVREFYSLAAPGAPKSTQ